MSKPYRPSNGTEGHAFYADWCAHCERDREFRESNGDIGNGCPILGATHVYDIDDPKYPPQWVQDDDGGNPRCTAYTEDPACPVRCDKTPDLFGAVAG